MGSAKTTLLVTLRRRSTRVGVRLKLLKLRLPRILSLLLIPMLLSKNLLLPLRKKSKSRLWKNTSLKRLTRL